MPRPKSPRSRRRTSTEQKAADKRTRPAERVSKKKIQSLLSTPAYHSDNKACRQKDRTRLGRSWCSVLVLRISCFFAPRGKGSLAPGAESKPIVERPDGPAFCPLGGCQRK